MNKILDKIVITVFCIVMVLNISTNEVTPIIAFLIAISVSALSQCYSKTRMSICSEIVYIILCISDPIYCCMLPLVFYDMVYNEKKFVTVCCAVPLLIYVKQFDYIILALLVGSLATSFMLCRHTKQLEETKKRLIEIRDSSTELNMLLSEKNKYLCESRDSEINVAILSERNRIAREIHDNVGHMLSRTLLQIGAVSVINKDENIKPALESVKDTLNSAMTSIRESVHNLHDDAIDLKGSVKDMAKALDSKFTVNTDLDFSENIPKNIKLCFMGIVKESISNILKHSNGDTVNITIREHPAFFQLMVVDNGTNDGKICEGGIGLENMKARAENLGGTFKFYAEKNQFKIFALIKKDK